MGKIENRQQYDWTFGRIEELVDIVTEEMSDNDPLEIEYRVLSDLAADYSDEHFNLGQHARSVLESGCTRRASPRKSLSGLSALHNQGSVTF